VFLSWNTFVDRFVHIHRSGCIELDVVCDLRAVVYRMLVARVLYNLVEAGPRIRHADEVVYSPCEECTIDRSRDQHLEGMSGEQD
jgi:hypothetical protein